MRFLRVVAGLLLSFLLLSENLQAADIGRASPAEAAERVASGAAILIDVREQAEWAQTGVAEPAILLPLSDLRGGRTRWAPFLGSHDKDKELILYCRSGNRSAIAARILANEGFKVSNAGAFHDWKNAKLPTRSVETAGE